MTNAKTKLSVTISMISYQDEQIIEECLNSIRMQDYPQELVYIQLIDGGSSDQTAELALKYDASFISMPEYKDHASKRGGLALTTADTDLAVFFSADNRFGSKTTLSKMVSAYEETGALGVSTLRYQHVKTDKALSRYFALNGGTDPLVVFLGLNDRLAYDQEKWNVKFQMKPSDKALAIDFYSFGQFPTIGANGFLYPVSVFKDSIYAEVGLHIDMAYEASETLKGIYAFVEDETIHHCIDSSVVSFVKRRVQYAGDYEFSEKRLYKIFNPKTVVPCILFAIYSLTLIFPIIRALKGFCVKRDFAWFLHPIICLAYTIGYTSFAVKKFIK